MKIVFLDVDGVLNHMDSQVGAIEDMAVFKLKNILNETKAQVVLSSDFHSLPLKAHLPVRPF